MKAMVFPCPICVVLVLATTPEASERGLSPRDACIVEHQVQSVLRLDPQVMDHLARLTDAQRYAYVNQLRRGFREYIVETRQSYEQSVRRGQRDVCPSEGKSQ